MATPLAIRHRQHGNTITSTFNKTTTQHHQSPPSTIKHSKQNTNPCHSHNQSPATTKIKPTNQKSNTTKAKPTTDDRPKPPLSLHLRAPPTQSPAKLTFKHQPSNLRPQPSKHFPATTLQNPKTLCNHSSMPI